MFRSTFSPFYNQTRAAAASSLVNSSSCSSLLQTPKRNIQLHEYQSAHLLHQYGIPIPRGNVAFNAKEAVVIARKFGTQYKEKFVVKAQVQTLGRQKGYFRQSDLRSGIHSVSTIEKLYDITEKMCGKTLFSSYSSPTFQPNKSGYLCQSVLIMEKLAIEKEFFIKIHYDLKNQCPVIQYSKYGGMSYDRILKQYPESMKSIHIDLNKSLDIGTLHNVAKDLGAPNQISVMVFLVKNLLECFLQRDAESIVINPLVLTKDQKLVAANCVVKIDDQSVFRQPEMFQQFDFSQLEGNDRVAYHETVKYIDMDGDIGVISNGAGLALATCDYLAELGAKPLNFAEIGNQNISDHTQTLFRLFESDPRCKVILVNSFGGIQDLGNFAEAIKDMVRRLKTKLTKPIVIRVKGSGKDYTEKLLKELMDEGHIKVSFEEDFDKVCELAINIAKEADGKQ